MASPIPISPLSAAHILVSWIQDHGREPHLWECDRQKHRLVSGLLYWRTFMKKIPGDTFSAVISTARTMVSHAPAPRMQTCLGSDCTARFAYTGYHFCPSCRADLGYDDEDTPRNGQHLAASDRHAAGSAVLATVTSTALRQYGLRDDLEPDMLLDEETVHSFDDWIAGQMNAWQRVSSKRRFSGRA